MSRQPDSVTVYFASCRLVSSIVETTVLYFSVVSSRSSSVASPKQAKWFIGYVSPHKRARACVCARARGCVCVLYACARVCECMCVCDRPQLQMRTNLVLRSFTTSFPSTSSPALPLPLKKKTGGGGGGKRRWGGGGDSSETRRK